VNKLAAQLAEQLARGAEPEVTEAEAPFVRAYRDFLAIYQPRFLAVDNGLIYVLDADTDRQATSNEGSCSPHPRSTPCPTWWNSSRGRS